jgi:hypothetical protein
MNGRSPFVADVSAVSRTLYRCKTPLLRAEIHTSLIDLKADRAFERDDEVCLTGLDRVSADRARNTASADTADNLF